MTAEIEKVEPDEWTAFKEEALSQLCFYYGIKPDEEQRIMNNFKEVTERIERNESTFTKESFVSLITDILIEADSRAFQ